MTGQVVQQINRVLWIKHHGHDLRTFAKNSIGIDPVSNDFTITIMTYLNVICFTCGIVALKMWTEKLKYDVNRVFESKPWCIGHHRAYHPEWCKHCMRKNITHCNNLNCPQHNMPFPLKPKSRRLPDISHE